MYKLVLVRHGQSAWNAENRFTGWTDVDLTDQGIEEAKKAAIKMKEAGLEFRYSYTSFLKRAIKTLNIILEEMDLMWIPVEKTWRLNEKHYGFLQGMNKVEAMQTFGEAQVKLWRRSYDIAPDGVPENDMRHPINDVRYAAYTDAAAHPATESLLDTTNRIIPLWENSIAENLREHKQVLIAAHGNSLRGIIKFLRKLSNQEILELDIPTGIPYVLELNEQMEVVKDSFLASPEELEKLMNAVKNQIKKN